MKRRVAGGEGRITYIPGGGVGVGHGERRKQCIVDMSVLPDAGILPLQMDAAKFTHAMRDHIY